MPFCLDCQFSGSREEFQETTAEDVSSHYEQGGFSRIPDYAFDRVGSLNCPECFSDQVDD